jgi:sterol desaturase/sphingolipid hydroxylase (fatty acid hydroxylase superfamily)
VKNLLIGQIFIILPFGHLYGYLQTKGIGLYSSPTLPSTTERFMHMVIYAVLDEFAFYYGHLWLHVNKTKWWNYRRVHKIHHEFTSPVALVASYCHPVEMVLSNILPLCGGMLVCGSHTYTGLVWTVFAVLGTQTHHCGYRWPWTPGFDHQPDFHDYHHEKFNTNYGLTGWCDALHGTDKLWKEYVVERDAKRAAARGEKGELKSGSKGSNLM